ncbi:hypothetical protein [Bradyrhizobium erythrophlei]|uniref:hypothetical protein n=1 Tax=Bradyrhizobium erythrophlei TaxID=1437360 RepID=UPI001AECDBEA|nr:hypothetical protein [Bradyrhizobium erythrophlei]
MNMHPRFETARASAIREVAVVSKILTDLVRTLELIESDIAAEEERASISDRSDPKYPMLARSLIERRNNIKMTIAALEQRITARVQGVATATDQRPRARPAATLRERPCPSECLSSNGDARPVFSTVESRTRPGP